MNSKEKSLEDFNYTYPKNLIAQKPASPRDSARLLIYSRKEKTTHLDTFKNLSKYLPPKTVLVFNKTKVVPARLEVFKETGGRVKLLYLEAVKPNLRFLADRKLALNSKLFLKNKKYSFKVIALKNGEYFLKPLFSLTLIPKILEQFGETPIPPYIKNSPLTKNELKNKYQTVFAEKPGSIAAPTASLHFSKKLINQLQKFGVKIEFLTLHVGQGTFASLTPEKIKTGKLHKEFFEISQKTIQNLNHLKKQGWKIIPVGTTSLRALETSSRKNSKLYQPSGFTQLFIRGNYRFKFADGLITNFHVPKSSLIMLVSAFAGRKKILNLYQLAIQKKFRLFSFGDGMLIL